METVTVSAEKKDSNSVSAAREEEEDGGSSAESSPAAVDGVPSPLKPAAIPASLFPDDEYPAQPTVSAPWIDSRPLAELALRSSSYI